MGYLVTTVEGHLYHDGLKLFSHEKLSLFSSGEKCLRFIRKYKDHYILGTSEELIFFRTTYKPEVIGSFSLPGMVDIKDVAIGYNFVAILSGLRDSVYVVDENFNNIFFCFNLSREGNVELFKSRQVQCNEINSNYFQVFYCPGMNKYHSLDRLKIDNRYLDVISDGICGGNKLCYRVDLSNFSCERTKYDQFSADERTLSLYKMNTKKTIPDEDIVTDYIEV